MMPVTGVDQLIIKIKTDMIVHSANDQSIWMGLLEIMVAAAVPVHLLQIQGHKSDLVECLHDLMDAIKKKKKFFNI